MESLVRSLVAPLALVPLLGCSDEAAASEEPAVAVDRELVDMYDDTRNFLDLTRAELIAELEERQSEFAALQDELETKAGSLESDAREAWDERRQEVERLRSELAEGILELKQTTDDSWKELRERLVEVTTDLRRELAESALPVGK